MGNRREEKGQGPSDSELADLLGKTKVHWDALVRHLATTHTDLVREWKVYGAKHGWQLKVADKKRAIVYLVPRSGGFTAALALRDEAVAAARGKGLPAELVRKIESEKVYPEGRPARIDVKGPSEVEIVKLLLAIKRSA